MAGHIIVRLIWCAHKYFNSLTQSKQGFLGWMPTLQERRSGLPQERGKQGVFASAREAGSKVKEATACDSIYINTTFFPFYRALSPRAGAGAGARGGLSPEKSVGAGVVNEEDHERSRKRARRTSGGGAALASTSAGAAAAAVAGELMVYGGGSEDEVDNVGGDGGELPKPGMYHPFSLFLCTSQTGQIHKCHLAKRGQKVRGGGGGGQGRLCHAGGTSLPDTASQRSCLSVSLSKKLKEAQKLHSLTQFSLLFTTLPATIAHTRTH